MRVLLWSLVVVLIGGLMGAVYLHWQPTESPPGEPETALAEIDKRKVRITGPHSHENLTVFLVHSDDQDQRDFLTLDEGLQNGQVQISELEQERVGQLHVENRSDQPLYLQEGDRLSGGKQDRIIAASLVLPPRSGKVSVPSFCIEQHRWKEGERGRKFEYTINTALAPKNVRGAAKYDNDQQSIWRAVAAQKDTGKTLALAESTNSSGNELLYAPRVQKLSDDCVNVLAGVLKQHSDAVGFVVVVNGQIEEANLYPNHVLCGKLYSRLLRSYALQAVMLKEQKGDGSLATADVVAFLQTGKEVKSQVRTIDKLNEARIRELAENRFECLTRYEGKPVHWQLMKQNGGAVANAQEAHGGMPHPALERARLLGNHW